MSLSGFAQNDGMSSFDKIVADIRSNEAASAAKRNWCPDHVGEIDIRIAVNGDWYHEGRRFQRQSLVKLFASVLRRESDDYFLVTPAEKLRIEVDDAPFVATLVESIASDTEPGSSEPAIVFTTNLGERILLDQDHPLQIEMEPGSKTPRPYLRVRENIDALISRSAFYDLINLAETFERDGQSYLAVRSLGQIYELGCIDESSE